MIMLAYITTAPSADAICEVRKMADRLSLDASAAIRAGMSYGNWKALHPNTDGTMPDFRRKPNLIPCPYCKTPFEPANAKQKYCSANCQYKMSYERFKARKKQQKEQARK